ncbi:MAG: hypothetical protein ACT4PJ_08075 [Gemmatimonadaceae bacterium]
MRHLGIAALALVASGILTSCDDDDGIELREGEPTRQGAMLADQNVVTQMRSTDSLGRIIYDPPPDLSLTSAQQRRPDIFGGRGAPSRPSPRDTTTQEGATRRARSP